MSFYLRVFALTVAIAIICGCDNVAKRDPEFSATLPAPMPKPAQQYSGAIYQAGYDMVLFEDIKARRVGDVLTIRLVEKTDASKQADANATKTTATEISNPTIFGTTPQFNLPSVFPLAVTSN